VAIDTTGWRATVVSGNPKPASRTGGVAVALARTLLGEGGTEEDVTLVELSQLTSGLFVWGDPDVAQAKAAVLGADVLVVASPVYKASFTGLLKAFLDQFGADELDCLATVPVMLGGAPVHALAPEGQLRPVLVEIGASMPTRSLFVVDSSLDTLDEQLASWSGRYREALLAVAAVRRTRRG